MSALFFQRGSMFTVGDSASTVVHDTLPAGNYVLKFNPTVGFFLETADAFTAPSKVYGKTTPRAGRILDTFTNRGASTGVLLTGEKGSGKTLLARQVSIEALPLGIPTIIINTDFCGDDFNTFIQNIHQPCIILFDEFEKIYGGEGDDGNKQEQILTLLDGVFPTQKLFILTVNNVWRLDDHLLNRPGRVFYRFDFTGLEKEFIQEYCADNLNDKSHIDRIVAISRLFYAFNFDMLKAMIEEMNRYNESPDDVMEVLNVKPQFVDEVYTVDVSIDGNTIDRERITNYSEWHGNPMDNFSFRVSWGPIGATEEYDEYYDTPKGKVQQKKAKAAPLHEQKGSIKVTQDHIAAFNDGKVFLKGSDNVVITMTKRESRSFNWRAF